MLEKVLDTVQKTWALSKNFSSYVVSQAGYGPVNTYICFCNFLSQGSLKEMTTTQGRCGREKVKNHSSTPFLGLPLKNRYCANHFCIKFCQKDR